ncbi:unnamed protein product [Prorocentrum cordatum]|uniref:Non-specific serine/threonine protein kinase n=1 Tax=Prorocentrum cordatum TaxID=2364126 RepID=A0ABN9XQ63_9DINO|nr:unnamed protein product [Polarella glacialis]
MLARAERGRAGRGRRRRARAHAAAAQPSGGVGGVAALPGASPPPRSLAPARAQGAAPAMGQACAQGPLESESAFSKDDESVASSGSSTASSASDGPGTCCVAGRGSRSRPESDGIKVQLPHTKGKRIEQFIDLRRDAGLGQGGCGTVCEGTDKATGARYAVKCVPKRRGLDLAILQREIRIMKLLDHPNVVKLFETYEDKLYYYLVMERCQGGELFDRIAAEKHFSEPVAAGVMQHVFRGVLYIQGQPIATRVGTPAYVAPEMLRAQGSGRPPGYGRERDILAKVARAALTWKGFAKVSADAKDLIQGLLTVDRTKRYTLDQALKHTWVSNAAPNAALVGLAGVVDNLKKFTSATRMKKMALHLVARQMDDRDMEHLRDIFTQFDANKKGTLTILELHEGLARAGVTDNGMLRKLAKALDSDNSGAIDYTEFLAAALDARAASQEAACRAAFRVFDKDDSGTISLEELAEALQSRDARHPVKMRSVEAIMAEVDTSGDGEIDFEEFMVMMRG